MDFGIEGKVALVTAATKGIGLGIAQALAREGARVSIVARTEADVKRVATEIKGFGVAADVTTEDGCIRSVEDTQKNLGPIDILVNNFGARAGSSWSDTGPKEFEAAFAGNVVVSARMSKLVLDGMIERGWGRIVVITSVWGREAGGAPILWDGGGWHRRQQADPQGIAEFVRNEMPMGRFGTVDEVANVVAFVCSTQASLLTGACINVDGGQSRS
ncbi:MAG: SDR family oxidoreductase, partial [Chloroflexi bacterium]